MQMSVKPNKKKTDNRNSLLLGASAVAVAAAAMAAAPALAQETEEEEAIVVTGSRIPQPNLVTTSPVTQLTADDITTQGVTRIEDMTNQLPQVFAAQGSNVSNGAFGTAQVNLRGLGPNRTLVLIDGHRMGYGSPNSVPPDLNQIPAAMVERVEVLTGGASAVYGSDAIAGVVNFIMRDDFEGFRLDAQYGFYQHSNGSEDGHIRDEIAFRGATNPAQYALPPDDVIDGYSKEITAIFGASTGDGRGNVTGYLGYRSNDANQQRDRDYSACAIANPRSSARPYAPAGTVHWTCGGSATSFPGYFYYGFPGVTPQTIDQATGNFVPFTNNNLYNFGPLNYFQRPDQRYSLGAFAHYEINEHAEVYAQAMFSDYRSIAQIAPSGDFFNTNTINCGNPFLPPNTTVPNASGDPLCTPAQIAANSTVSLYIARRNVEGGPRQDDLNYESYRTLIGIRGSLNQDWDYDVSASYHRVNLARTYRNDFSVARMNRALNVVNTGPDGILGNGDDAPICQSVLDGVDAACVPWNVFTPGGVTPEALAYLQIPLMQRGETVQQNVLASVTGDLGFGSPAAETNIETAFGLEYRRDELNTDTDSAWAVGDGAGQGGPNLGLNGVTDVFEVFGEARIPLIEGAAFANLLSIDLAYRFSDYNSGTTTDTYKVGAEWAPTDDIRFRASQQRAIRAPNIIELFGAQGAGLFNLGFDPCDDVNSPLPVPAICIGAAPYQVSAAQSASGGLNNPAGQYNGIFGGNPDLQPEEADTTTLGFVFTPSFLPGLNVSVDWFSIDLTNAVAVPAASIVTSCYYGGDLSSCALITRNTPGNGRMWGSAVGVFAIGTNIGGTSTQGVDINASYSHDMGSLGALNFQLIGTYVDELLIDLGAEGIPVFDCAGKWSGDANCGTPTFEWRHRFRVSWETPWNLEASLTWRYFDQVQREGGVPFPGTVADPAGSCGSGPTFNPNCNRLGTILDAVSFFDLGANWEVNDHARLRFGVNNILDQDPPLSTNTHVGVGAGNGNTFPQVDDSSGRFVFVGLTVDF
jgi:outer membrane receptor protein involved in Fe transport